MKTAIGKCVKAMCVLHVCTCTRLTACSLCVHIIHNAFNLEADIWSVDVRQCIVTFVQRNSERDINDTNPLITTSCPYWYLPAKLLLSSQHPPAQCHCSASSGFSMHRFPSELIKNCFIGCLWQVIPWIMGPTCDTSSVSLTHETNQFIFFPCDTTGEI